MVRLTVPTCRRIRSGSTGELDGAGKERSEPGAKREENLRIFEDMKDGKYADGAMVLRAKIDMSSPNINMRIRFSIGGPYDPSQYRGQVVHLSHVRLLLIPLEDAFEGITHSICTLEFEDHRPL